MVPKTEGGGGGRRAAATELLLPNEYALNSCDGFAAAPNRFAGEL